MSGNLTFLLTKGECQGFHPVPNFHHYILIEVFLLIRMENICSMSTAKIPHKRSISLNRIPTIISPSQSIINKWFQGQYKYKDQGHFKYKDQGHFMLLYFPVLYVC